MKTDHLTAIFFTLLLGGCASISEVDIKQKKESLSRLSVEHIFGEPIDDFFRHRMADVVVGLEISRVEYADNGKRKLVFKGKRPKNFEFFLGSAAALSEPGYFLTAAHNVVGEDNIWLVSKSREDPYYGRASVVWVMKKPDLALVHMEASPLKCFNVMSNTPRVDSLVILGGHRGGCSAGKIVSVKHRIAGNNPYLEIEHTSPFVRGDSGGPLITPEGQLLGINHSWTARALWTKYNSTQATAIDWKILQKTIEDDITKRSTATR
jgi:S1-C subfamily serine protease